MRVLCVLVLLGACAFEPGYSPGVADGAVGGQDSAGDGPGEASGGGGPDMPPVPRTCKVSDPELRLCIEMDDRVFSPMVTDGAPGRLDAMTQQVTEAPRGDQFAARLTNTSTIQIPEADLLDPLDGLTIELWVQPTDRRPAALLTNAGQYLVQLTDSNQIVCGVTDARVTSDARDAAQPGVWTHIACTFDNDTLAVYVNGQCSEATSIKGGSLSDAGTTGTLVGGGFVGLLDDLRIYGRAFDDAEVCARAGDACAD